jgi:hypothetical protein
VTEHVQTQVYGVAERPWRPLTISKPDAVRPSVLDSLDDDPARVSILWPSFRNPAAANGTATATMAHFPIVFQNMVASSHSW